MFILLVSVVSMFIQELILEEGHPISGNKALSWISTSVAHHDSFQVNNFLFGRGQFVKVDDLMSEIGNVDTCIALPSHIKIILFEIGELLEKG